MSKYNKKALMLLLAGIIVCPKLSFASEIVEYKARNLDEILIKNDMPYDAEAVKTRKEEYRIYNDTNIDPDYELVEVVNETEIEVTDEGNVEIVEEDVAIVKDVTPSPLEHKTAVYDRVVDISEHQNPDLINYDKFASDIDGAILRTSITDAKTLNIRKDYKFDTHYKELDKRGVPLGFYHYSRAVNAKEAEREAQFVSNVLKGKNVSLPVYIDIEDDKRQQGASKAKISEAAEAFIMAMNRNGYVAGIYSYPWFAETYLTKDVRNKYEFWIADYASKGITKYNKSNFDSWQFTDKARVNGYKYGVDMSKVYRDYPLILKGKSKKSMDQLVNEVIAGKWGHGAERKKRLAYAGYDYNKVQAAVNNRLRIAKG